MTKVDIGLASDADMFLFLEEGMRGGVSYISKRYSRAIYMYLKIYKTKQELKYILYLDVSNLYDYSMSKLLSTSGFKRIHLKEFDLNKYSRNSSKSCVVEVDLKYPRVTIVT